MLRKDLFLAGAGITSALALGAIAGTGAALATTQDSSDADLIEVRGRVAGILIQLQGLKHDYAGNRNNAIAALQTAQNELNAAIALRTDDQIVSDTVMHTAQREIGSLINRLQGDLGDYSGHRQNAINALTQTQGSLNAALHTA